MRKIGNVTVGSKDEQYQIGADWAMVHACKTSHQQRLGYTRPIKDSPHYITFRDSKHLYINWVDEPTGRYFRVDTFIEALDFIDEYAKSSEVFIHCDQGQSRSPTLAMVYLAKRTDFLEDDFEVASIKFRELYPNYAPSGIIKFVESHWSEIR